MNGSRLKRLALVTALALAGCGSAVVAQQAVSEKLHRADATVPARTSGAPEPMLAADVVNGFDFLYRFITETEFVLCLEGRIVNRQVHVEAFRLARIDASSATHVRYQPCASHNYIGTAHNHPPSESGDQCGPSDLDRRSFASDTRALIDIVLCGDGEYAWAAKDGRSGVASLPTQPDSNTTTVAARPRPPRN